MVASRQPTPILFWRRYSKLKKIEDKKVSGPENGEFFQDESSQVLW
jgi:hypothetical protein